LQLKWPDYPSPLQSYFVQSKPLKHSVNSNKLEKRLRRLTGKAIQDFNIDRSRPTG